MIDSLNQLIPGIFQPVQ